MSSDLPLEPLGPYVLIKIEDLNEGNEKSQRIGKIVTTHSTDDYEREMEFQEKGHVVAIGPDVYNLSHQTPNQVSVGDKVLYRKYDGVKHVDRATGDYYRIVVCEDLIAKLKR